MNYLVRLGEGASDQDPEAVGRGCCPRFLDIPLFILTIAARLADSGRAFCIVCCVCLADKNPHEHVCPRKGPFPFRKFPAQMVHMEDLDG